MALSGWTPQTMVNVAQSKFHKYTHKDAKDCKSDWFSTKPTQQYVYLHTKKFTFMDN